LPFFIFSYLSLAESLYTHGYYDLAVTEYKRLFFFNPELRDNRDAYFSYCISLIKTNQDKGVQELDYLLVDFPELAPKIKVIKAKYYISQGNYYWASEILKDTQENTLLGYTYILGNNLPGARDIFIDDGNYELAKEIDNFIKKEKKSAGKAMLFSMLVPGTGEVYAGNIKLGIIDFFLNFGSGYLLYNALREKKYVDMGLIFSFLLNRFYLGSIHNAQHSAEEWNKRRREEWLKKIAARYFPNTLDFDY